MKNSRDAILADIAQALGRKTPKQPAKADLAPITLQRVTDVDLVALFCEQAEQARSEMVTTTQDQLVPSVLSWLKAQKLTATVNLAPALQKWDWQDLPVSIGGADEHSVVSITPCTCGIAETGTLLCLSSPEHPTTLNFLPEVHVALLNKQDIVATYEQAWQRVPETLPRTANFISGPSRTGDIEQTLQFGAHGPKRLVIFLYGVSP